MNTATVPALPLPGREYNDPQRFTVPVTHHCPDPLCGQINKLKVYGALLHGKKVPKGDYVFVCSECGLPVLVRVDNWPEVRLQPLYLAASKFLYGEPEKSEVA